MRPRMDLKLILSTIFIVLLMCSLITADKATMERIRKHQEWLKQRNQVRNSLQATAKPKKSIELLNLWRFDKKDNSNNNNNNINEVYPENDNILTTPASSTSTTSTTTTTTTTPLPTTVKTTLPTTTTTTTRAPLPTPSPTLSPSPTTATTLPPIITTNLNSFIQPFNNTLPQFNSNFHLKSLPTTTNTTTTTISPTSNDWLSNDILETTTLPFTSTTMRSTTTTTTRKPKTRPYPRWANWGAWSECSRSCGGGIKYQLRKCVNRSVYAQDTNGGDGNGGSPPTDGDGNGGSPPTNGDGNGGSPPTDGDGNGGSPPTDGDGNGGSPPTGGNGNGGSPPTGGNGDGGSPPTGGGTTTTTTTTTGGSTTTVGSTPSTTPIPNVISTTVVPSNQVSASVINYINNRITQTLAANPEKSESDLRLTQVFNEQRRRLAQALLQPSASRNDASIAEETLQIFQDFAQLCSSISARLRTAIDDLKRIERDPNQPLTVRYEALRLINQLRNSDTINNAETALQSYENFRRNTSTITVPSTTVRPPAITSSTTASPSTLDFYLQEILRILKQNGMNMADPNVHKLLQQLLNSPTQLKKLAAALHELWDDWDDYDEWDFFDIFSWR